MANTTLVFNHRQEIDFGLSNNRGSRAFLQRLHAALGASLAGSGPLAEDFTCVPNISSYATPAAAQMIFASVDAGDITVTVGGAALSGGAVTYATSDANTAGLVTAAINASTGALHAGLVRASRYTGSLALSTVLAGTIVEIFGYRFIATASATGLPNQFSISGNDTADATALANAINACPGLNSRVKALTSTSTVYIHKISDAAAAADEKLYASATTVTVTQVAASARILICSYLPSTLANHITIAVSHTGSTPPTFLGSATRLSGGIGGNSTSAKIGPFGGTGLR